MSMRIVNDTISFQHKEAFCLMKYASDGGRTVEWIWNSRDGVTPFIVMSLDGIEMLHVQWSLDRYLPNYQPLPGERIFVDLTEQGAAEIAEKIVEKNENHNTENELKQLVHRMVETWMRNGEHQPHVISVRDWQRLSPSNYPGNKK